MGANHETIDRSTAVEAVFDFRSERPLLEHFGHWSRRVRLRVDGFEAKERVRVAPYGVVE